MTVQTLRWHRKRSAGIANARQSCEVIPNHPVQKVLLMGELRIGSEVWIAAEHPMRLSGQYGHVVELDERFGWVLVELSRDRSCSWVRAPDVVPAYIVGEL
jgi:hypothetical protein